MSSLRLLLAALLLPVVLAGATDPVPADAGTPARWRDLFRSRAISVVSENDKYFASTDRHYTNGFKLSFLGETRVDESPDLLQKIVEYVPTLNSETARRQFYRVGVSLGHNTYTPGDTDTSAPIPTDRPYAGWFYAALTFQAQSDDSRLLRVVELSLGNIRTNVAAGFAVRLGWWLPPDFGADLIRPAGGNVIQTHHLSAYLFGSGEARAVARDIFLDGNTWRDSPSVDKRPVVADLNLGLVLRLPVAGPRLKVLQLTYTQNYRTKEFYGQAQHDVFGSVGISFIY